MESKLTMGFFGCLGPTEIDRNESHRFLSIESIIVSVIMEAIVWQSAQYVEQKLIHRGRNGQWLVGLTKQAKKRSLKSAFLIAQKTRSPSASS
jgi:hypothetical protein